MGRWGSRRLSLLVLAVALATGPAYAGFSIPPVVDAVVDPLLDRDVAADEAYLTGRLNEERRARGLRALSVRRDLVDAARRQAARMAAKLEIWHNPALAGEIVGWLTIGENVGWSRTTAQDLHQAFMDSPEHRENILWPAYNEIGIGEVVGADGRIFAAQVFAERRSRASAPATAPAVAPARSGAASRDGRPASVPAPIEPVPPRTLSLLLQILRLE